MASTLSNGLQKVMDGAAFQNPKLADISKDTKDSHDSNARLTTDWGSKVSDTDHWLTVSTEDQYGPALLEDGHAREKVSAGLQAYPTRRLLTSSQDTPIRSRAYTGTSSPCPRCRSIRNLQALRKRPRRDECWGFDRHFPNHTSLPSVLHGPWVAR